jgi:aromatic-amino-acid transaminase
MFDDLTMPPADKILSLMPIFRQDGRSNKIDLGVGVYRDASGTTPIPRAVREAEKRIHTAQTTKAYVDPAGDPVFCDLIGRLVFGEAAPWERIRGIQTPGGAGALTVLAGLIYLARPGAAVHVPDPTWVNHVSILEDNRLRVVTYPYLDSRTGEVDFDALLDHFSRAERGDIVLLHGCCHNPTGADPSRSQWQALAEIIAERGLVPLVDIAYQGFGEGLEDDAFVVRLLAGMVPEMLVSSSCSKNFGIYRERTGAAFILAANADRADAAKAQLTVRARVVYSMPPDHGSAIVRTVLEDPALAADWRAELDDMRSSILSLRQGLAASFRRFTNGSDYDFLAKNKGMFSLIGLTPREAVMLRERHAIYIVEDGRINVAGLQASQIDTFAEAVLAVRGIS